VRFWRRVTGFLSVACFGVAIYVLGFSYLDARTRGIWGVVLILLGLFWLVIG
jgi:membrane-bound ClpP family serine protease